MNLTNWIVSQVDPHNAADMAALAQFQRLVTAAAASADAMDLLAKQTGIAAASDLAHTLRSAALGQAGATT